jgi:inner membrane protein
MNFPIHALSGVVLARAVPAQHRSGAVVAGMAAAACLPDVDCISIFWGMSAWHAVHRGFTHSLIGIVVTSLLFAFAYRAYLAPRGGIRLAFVYAWILIAQLTHILLDLLTPSGVRILQPFASARISFGTDISGNNPLVLWLLAAMAIWMYRVEVARFAFGKLGWQGADDA